MSNLIMSVKLSAVFWTPIIIFGVLVEWAL